MAKRPEAGMTIEGKYRLERELGAGGMGAVWLATQLMVDRKVAVKLLHPMFLDEEDLQARFEVEAKAIGRLNHPNCITLYDFGFSDELSAFYTVIEYIEGVALDKRLGMVTPLPDVLSIIRQIAMALDHAHHHGIVHRDLKPENIMLAQMTDGSEMVKVLDFGIARIMKGDGDGESQRITKAGEVFGTPAYMSPEQARSVRQITPAADLYAVGIMFYELIVGRLPFEAESAFDILMMHVTKPVPPIENPDIPNLVKDIVYRLLEKEPEARYQSGKALLVDLKKVDAAAIGDVSVNISRQSVEEHIRFPNSTPTPTLGPDARVVTDPSISFTGLGEEDTLGEDENDPDATLLHDTRALQAGVEQIERVEPSKKPWVFVGVALVIALGLAGLLIAVSNSDSTEVVPQPEVIPEVVEVEEPTEETPEAMVFDDNNGESEVAPKTNNGEEVIAAVEPVEPEKVEEKPATTKKKKKKRKKKPTRVTKRTTKKDPPVEKPKPKRDTSTRKFDVSGTKKKEGFGNFDVKGN